MGRKKLPSKQRKDIVIGVRCDSELKLKLDRIVARTPDLTLVQAIRTALREFVEKQAAA